jgi:hypothetical protein
MDANLAHVGDSIGRSVYDMRMARVNITVPDEVMAQARAAGLNVSRVATAALIDDLDKRAKIEAVDAYLAQLEMEHGPIPDDELAAANAWADRVLAPNPTRSTQKRRRSA